MCHVSHRNQAANASDGDYPNTTSRRHGSRCHRVSRQDKRSRRKRTYRIQRILMVVAVMVGSFLFGALATWVQQVNHATYVQGK